MWLHCRHWHARRHRRLVRDAFTHLAESWCPRRMWQPRSHSISFELAVHARAVSALADPPRSSTGGYAVDLCLKPTVNGRCTKGDGDRPFIAYLRVAIGRYWNAFTFILDDPSPRGTDLYQPPPPHTDRRAASATHLYPKSPLTNIARGNAAAGPLSSVRPRI